MPHEWDSPEYVRKWVEDGDKTDPERAEQITALVNLIRRSAEEPIEVLDLGAGYGIVTREILTAYPNAQVVCLDGSGEMLKHGKARLTEWQDQLYFIVSNFDSPDWLQLCLRIDSLMRWSHREPFTMWLTTVNRRYTRKSFSC